MADRVVRRTFKSSIRNQSQVHTDLNSLHALTRDTVMQYVDWDLGEIAVGHSKDIREEFEWGRHGNKKLHDWSFDTIIGMIDCKPENSNSQECHDFSHKRTSKALIREKRSEKTKEIAR